MMTQILGNTRFCPELFIALILKKYIKYIYHSISTIGLLEKCNRYANVMPSTYVN